MGHVVCFGMGPSCSLDLMRSPSDYMKDQYTYLHKLKTTAPKCWGSRYSDVVRAAYEQLSPEGQGEFDRLYKGEEFEAANEYLPWVWQSQVYFLLWVQEVTAKAESVELDSACVSSFLPWDEQMAAKTERPAAIELMAQIASRCGFPCEESEQSQSQGTPKFRGYSARIETYLHCNKASDLHENDLEIKLKLAALVKGIQHCAAKHGSNSAVDYYFFENDPDRKFLGLMQDYLRHNCPGNFRVHLVELKSDMIFDNEEILSPTPCSCCIFLGSKYQNLAVQENAEVTDAKDAKQEQRWFDFYFQQAKYLLTEMQQSVFTPEEAQVIISLQRHLFERSPPTTLNVLNFHLSRTASQLKGCAPLQHDCLIALLDSMHQTMASLPSATRYLVKPGFSYVKNSDYRDFAFTWSDTLIQRVDPFAAPTARPKKTGFN